MSKTEQRFLTEAYLKYVEGINPRRTPLIGKRAISGWKLAEFAYRNQIQHRFLFPVNP